MIVNFFCTDTIPGTRLFCAIGWPGFDWSASYCLRIGQTQCPLTHEKMCYKINCHFTWRCRMDLIKPSAEGYMALLLYTATWRVLCVAESGASELRMPIQCEWLVWFHGRWPWTMGLNNIKIYWLPSIMIAIRAGFASIHKNICCIICWRNLVKIYSPMRISMSHNLAVSASHCQQTSMETIPWTITGDKHEPCRNSKHGLWLQK